MGDTKNLKDMLDEYFKRDALERAIFEAFGFKDQWRAFPLWDIRAQYWLRIESRDTLAHNTEPFTKENIEEGKHSSCVLHKTMHMTKSVFEAEGMVMALGDTQCDGNIALFVMDASRECKDAELLRLYDDCW